MWIPLRGNIWLCEYLMCVFIIPLERTGIFKHNVAARIQASKETFWNPQT